MKGPGSLEWLEVGSLRLSCNPLLAGRIIEFSHDGESVLSGSDVHPTNFGSTYWTSPQADWGWPPLAEIDSSPFVLDRSPGCLALTGPEARLGAGRVRLVKEYRVAPGVEAIDVVYRLDNVGDVGVRVAGWEISRVPPKGLTFFPTGEHEITPILPHAPLELMRHGELSYFDHTHFVPGLSRKVHADGREGYLAHVARSSSGRSLLFLKIFQDAVSSEQAPGEGEVEIFANEDGAYVEVEVQGRYLQLEPRQSGEFAVRWALVPLPMSLTSPWNLTKLAQLARGFARELGPPPSPS